MPKKSKVDIKPKSREPKEPKPDSLYSNTKLVDEIAQVLGMVLKKHLDDLAKKGLAIPNEVFVSMLKDSAVAVTSMIVSMDYDMATARTIFFMDTINKHVDNKVAKDLAEALGNMRIV